MELETQFGRAVQPFVHKRSRLIVVEDDPVTRAMIAGFFVKEGFDIAEAESAAECRALLAERDADLLFIDIELPDGNGIALSQQIRESSAAGIILVTQRDTEFDRILGLELVADDYVTKPVNLRELLARTRALLRRRRLDSGRAAQSATTLSFGPWRLDLIRRTLVTREGATVALTRGEFDLLAALALAEGRPLNREHLMGSVSKRDHPVDTRTIDALVVRLRRKLAASGSNLPVIATVAGIGYMLGIAIDDAN